MIIEIRLKNGEVIEVRWVSTVSSDQLKDLMKRIANRIVE